MDTQIRTRFYLRGLYYDLHIFRNNSVSFSVVLHTVDGVSGVAVFLDGIMTHLREV